MRMAQLTVVIFVTSCGPGRGNGKECKLTSLANALVRIESDVKPLWLLDAVSADLPKSARQSKDDVVDQGRTRCRRSRSSDICLSFCSPLRGRMADH